MSPSQHSPAASDAESDVPPLAGISEEIDPLDRLPGLPPTVPGVAERMVRATKAGVGKSKQNYDKVNSCVFCSKLIKQKIQRHLCLKHKDEAEVQAFLSEPAGEKRRKAVLVLMCLGNHHYNERLLNQNLPGELIVLKRPHSDTPASRFVPCHACFGYVLKVDLWRHIKNCPCATEREQMLGNRTLGALSEGKSGCDENLKTLEDEDFFETVVAKMRADDVREVIIRDALMINLGKHVLTKKGNCHIQVAAIRSRLRSLAKLILCMQRKCGHKLTLEALLQPRHFDSIISSVQEVFESEMADANYPPNYSKPSFAVKLGCGLKKAAELALSGSVKAGDGTKQQALIDYLARHTGEWGDRTSQAALWTRNPNKTNSVDPLPLTEDVVMLSDGTQEKMEELVRTLSGRALGRSEMKSQYNQLVQLTCASVILFNRRRGGDAAKLLVETYQERKKTAMSGDVMSHLSPLEQKLADSMDLVEMIGKRNRRIPVLLTPCMTKAMDLLIWIRPSVGVPTENLYLFAKAGGKHHVEAWTVMKYACLGLDLKNLDLITGTRLRKYLATVTQLMNLDNSQLEWVSNHLGHDLKVHGESGRLANEVPQLCKISQLLLASEQGQVHQYASKTLEEIDIGDLIKHLE